jgi:hypothetical protein
MDISKALSHGFPSRRFTFNGEPSDLANPSNVLVADDALPLPTPTEIQAAWDAYVLARPDLDAARATDELKALQAVVRWVAPLVGKTPAQARSEIIAIYKALP